MAVGVFVYGSLMFDAVWSRVVKRSYGSAAADARGFVRVQVPGEEYPALLRHDTASTRGLLWKAVDGEDLQRLDAFEGFEYERILIDVDVEGAVQQAWVYLWLKPEGLDPDRIWDPEHFKAVGLPRFLGQHVHSWEAHGQRK